MTKAKMNTVEVLNCDPREREDCYTVTEDDVRAFLETKEALHKCQKRM